MRVDAIVTSPLVRAVQTADLLAEGLEYGGEVFADPILASGLSRSEIPLLAEAHGAKAGLAIVGHNPHLTELVCDLVVPDGNFCMKKGAVVAVRLPEPKGGRRAEFLWMIVDGRRYDKLSV
jgi:phosphohistidine phosphatase